MAKANPFIKGKVIAVPKGKKKGDTFTKDGKRYIVISYVSSTGKRIRYGKPIAKKRVAKKKATKSRKRNPYAGGRCAMPRSTKNWRSGHRHTSKGRKCVVQRTKARNTYYSLVHDKLGKSSSSVSIPKGKRSGDTFTSKGKKYTVVSYLRNGKRIRYARKA